MIKRSNDSYTVGISTLAGHTRRPIMPLCIVGRRHATRYVAVSMLTRLMVELQYLPASSNEHPFNGPLFGTTQVSRYQKGKTNLDFYWSKRQWVAVASAGQDCTSLQTDNHASIPPLSFFTGRMPFLPPNQQRQSIEGMTRLNMVELQYLPARLLC